VTLEALEIYRYPRRVPRTTVLKHSVVNDTDTDQPNVPSLLATVLGSNGESRMTVLFHFNAEIITRAWKMF
jgi:hypothetical protein